MSIPLCKRAKPTQFNVVTKAQDLFMYTRSMIKNDKHFPKKERFMLVKDFYEFSKDMVCSLMEANDLNLAKEWEKELRYQKQKLALLSGRKLTYLIRQAWLEKYISTGTYEFWTKQVLGVIVLIQAWIKSDSLR